MCWAKIRSTRGPIATHSDTNPDKFQQASTSHLWRGAVNSRCLPDKVLTEESIETSRFHNKSRGRNKSTKNHVNTNQCINFRRTLLILRTATIVLCRVVLCKSTVFSSRFSISVQRSDNSKSGSWTSSLPPNEKFKLLLMRCQVSSSERSDHSSRRRSSFTRSIKPTWPSSKTVSKSYKAAKFC